MLRTALPSLVERDERDLRKVRECHAGACVNECLRWVRSGDAHGEEACSNGGANARGTVLKGNRVLRSHIQAAQALKVRIGFWFGPRTLGADDEHLVGEEVAHVQFVYEHLCVVARCVGDRSERHTTRPRLLQQYEQAVERAHLFAGQLTEARFFSNHKIRLVLSGQIREEEGGQVFVGSARNVLLEVFGCALDVRRVHTQQLDEAQVVNVVGVRHGAIHIKQQPQQRRNLSFDLAVDRRGHGGRRFGDGEVTRTG